MSGITLSFRAGRVATTTAGVLGTCVDMLTGRSEPMRVDLPAYSTPPNGLADLGHFGSSKAGLMWQLASLLDLPRSVEHPTPMEASLFVVWSSNAAPDKRIIVVGERDEVPERRGRVASCTVNCRGCAYCWPGLFGAKKVACELQTKYVMIPRPHKDMRELLTAGGLWLDLVELF